MGQDDATSFQRRISCFTERHLFPAEVGGIQLARAVHGLRVGRVDVAVAVLDHDVRHRLCGVRVQAAGATAWDTDAAGDARVHSFESRARLLLSFDGGGALLCRCFAGGVEVFAGTSSLDPCAVIRCVHVGVEPGRAESHVLLLIHIVGHPPAAFDAHDHLVATFVRWGAKNNDRVLELGLQDETCSLGVLDFESSSFETHGRALDLGVLALRQLWAHGEAVAVCPDRSWSWFASSAASAATTKLGHGA